MPLTRLASSDASRQAIAVLAQSGLACHGDAALRNAILESGVLPVVMHLLQEGSSSAPPGVHGNPPQTDAAGLLAGLTEGQNEHSRERCRAIADAGAIPVLLHLLVTGKDPTGLLQTCAATALDNMALQSEERCSAIVAAGGVPALLGALQRSRGQEPVLDLQRRAASCAALCWIANASAAHCAAIAQAGGIPLLVRSMEASCRQLPLAGANEQSAVQQSAVSLWRLGSSGAIVNMLASDTVRGDGWYRGRPVQRLHSVAGA